MADRWWRRFRFLKLFKNTFLQKIPPRTKFECSAVLPQIFLNGFIQIYPNYKRLTIVVNNETNPSNQSQKSFLGSPKLSSFRVVIQFSVFKRTSWVAQWFRVRFEFPAKWVNLSWCVDSVLTSIESTSSQHSASQFALSLL